jgi:hypothetical protein
MSRNSDPNTAAKAARATADAVERRMVAVPRAWLVLLPVLVVVPWLIVAAMYWRDRPSEVPADVMTGGPTTVASSAAWGTLRVTPIIVSPPMEFVGPDWGRPAEQGLWFFPETTPEWLDRFLSSSNLTPDQLARLKGTARLEPRIRGIIVSPEETIVQGLSPEARAAIYRQLGRNGLNFDQANPFKFYGASAEDWLRGSSISPQTRALIEPLIYRDKDFLHFADGELVHDRITDAAELRKLAKVLLRQSTMLVRLDVGVAADVPALATYWGRGGRSTDVRPLLESVAGASDDHSIDIVHLLPSFARNRLYRYPQPTTANEQKPLLANCLWTALNFFRPIPDDRFLNVDVALQALREDYYVVEGEYQLGDIIGFVDAEGDLFHVAVYIADDLVFTKNGTSPVTPWTLMPLGRVAGYYHLKSEDPRLIYHRRKDF